MWRCVGLLLMTSLRLQVRELHHVRRHDAGDRVPVAERLRAVRALRVVGGLPDLHPDVPRRRSHHSVPALRTVSASTPSA